MFLGYSGGLDTDGNELPRLVYVSREKRPGFQHHKKAGAMNALVCYVLASYLICLMVFLMCIYIYIYLNGCLVLRLLSLGPLCISRFCLSACVKKTVNGK